MTTVIGTTYESNSGVATFSPSTAPRTVMAGVIMPSPYSSERRRCRQQDQRRRDRASARARGSSAVSARMPPSPWLSARITMAMYLIEMMRSSE